MTTTETINSFGPRQLDKVKRDTEAIRLWAIDMTEAVKANDADRVAQLASTIAYVAGRVTDIDPSGITLR